MKQLIGHDLGTYTFNASAKTVTLTGGTFTLDQILLVVDSTLGVILYATGSGVAATYAAGVLTLASVPGGAANTDKLQVYVDVPAVVQAISATALPLPAGAALESGGNLAAIKADVDKIPAQGQALAAGSTPVVLTALQVTALTPPAALTNFANETGGNLAAIKADVDKIPAQGQALAAGCTPVVLPALQITALTPPAALTNYAAETGGNLAAIKTDVDKIPAQGQALAAASMPVVLTAIQVTALTPPAALTNFANETGGNLAAAKADLDTIAGSISGGKQKMSAAAGDVVVELSDATNIIGTTTHPVQTQDQSSKSTTAASGATAPTSASLEGTIAETSLPTAVSAGQLVGAMSDKFGRSVTLPYTLRDLTGTVSLQTTDTSSHTLIAGVSGIFSDITTLVITNESAVATVVSLSDGTTTYKIAIAANGGGVIPLPLPLAATTVATNWTVQASATATLDFIAVYAKNK